MLHSKSYVDRWVAEWNIDAAVDLNPNLETKGDDDGNDDDDDDDNERRKRKNNQKNDKGALFLKDFEDDADEMDAMKNVLPKKVSDMIYQHILFLVSSFPNKPPPLNSFRITISSKQLKWLSVDPGRQYIGIFEFYSFSSLPPPDKCIELTNLSSRYMYIDLSRFFSSTRSCSLGCWSLSRSQ